MPKGFYLLVTSILAIAQTGCAGSKQACTEPVAAAAPSADVASDLGSWKDGTARTAILEFVAKVTNPRSPDFVPESERIAVFDNDGTLWSEQPIYVQVAFALDRVKALAPEHPEWRGTEPFEAALTGDMKGLASAGNEGLLKLIMATHAGMTTDQFREVVLQWLKTARHPKYDRPYTELVYAPMVELLGYLRAHGFKTFIVSGGGVDFMRPWAEAAYGIPPEQVIGSRLTTEFDMTAATPVVLRRPEVDFIDDGPGKPVAIHSLIGRRPIFAAGNSDGDLHMLLWTSKRPGPHFSLLVHHTDDAREVAYDRESAIGKLDKALELAADEGWLVVDMKGDWNTVFAFQAATAPQATAPQATAPQATAPQ